MLKDESKCLDRDEGGINEQADSSGNGDSGLTRDTNATPRMCGKE